MQLTEEMARAAAQDAGNRSMREAGRALWNDADWNAACDKYERLWPQPAVQTVDCGHTPYDPEAAITTCLKCGAAVRLNQKTRLWKGVA